MTDLSDIAARELPPKSHNNPPSDSEILGEQLTLKHVHAIRSAQADIAISEQIPDHFTAENEATYTTDLIKKMQNLTKEIERRRKEEKEPFLRQGQYVDSFFSELTDGLAAAIAKAKKPLDDWLRRKADAERVEREQIAKDIREQQEAALKTAVAAQSEDRPEAVDRAVEFTQQVKVADAIAAAPVTTMAKTIGKSGSAAKLNMKWVGEIRDVDVLDLNKLRPYIARAELDKALDRYVKQGGRQCEGATILEIIETNVR